MALEKKRSGEDHIASSTSFSPPITPGEKATSRFAGHASAPATKGASKHPSPPPTSGHTTVTVTRLIRPLSVLALFLTVTLIMSGFISVDLLSLATNASLYLSSILPVTTTAASDGSAPPQIALLSFDSRFETDVLGPGAAARKIADLPWQAFHEAGVYDRRLDALYITSNYGGPGAPINITVVPLGDPSYANITTTNFPGLYAANGGTSWFPPGTEADHATPPAHVYCDQGTEQHYSALVSVDPVTNTSTPLVTSFLGRNFSSVNDVRQHPVTGDLWFTDAAYGYFQAFRPPPVVPQQVYRLTPSTGELAVVADGFVQPNGLEFSPDLRTLYVSDTGAINSVGLTLNPEGPSTVYAFDVVGRGRRLANRRTFAFVEVGLPDGIHCDTDGNVWAACGDGVHVWDPEGKLLGKVDLGETSNNLAFAPGKVFVFSNYRLWVVENIKAQGREVCKDFGVGC